MWRSANDNIDRACFSLSYHRFKSLKFLLVDSQVPRDTKQLVAGVAAKKAAVSLILYQVSSVRPLTGLLVLLIFI